MRRTLAQGEPGQQTHVLFTAQYYQISAIWRVLFDVWHFLKYFEYQVVQCIQATRYQVVFQRQEFRCFLLVLQLIRPLLVEVRNYTAKQPCFLFGKMKNNTIFTYNTVQSQLYIAMQGRTMF